MQREMVIGVDLGGTNMRMGLVDDQRRIVSQLRETSQVHLGARDLSERLCRACRSLMEEAVRRGGAVKAVGLGVAGKIDHVEGRVIFSPNIQELNGYPLASELQQILKIPVLLENDANAFGYGEHWLVEDPNIHNWIGFTLGTGVGGCVVLDDRLWHGDNLGFVGEVGHMTILPGGPLCNCGKRGCLEALSSGTALVQGIKDAISTGRLTSGPLYVESEAETLTPKKIYEYAEQGDPLARQLFERMGWALGIAVSNLFTALGIRHAMIGGGVSAAWNQFIEPLKKSMEDNSSMLGVEEMVILRSRLKDDAALLGAARLAFEI